MENNSEILSVEKKQKKSVNISMKKAILLSSIAVVLIGAILAGVLIFGKKEETEKKEVQLFEYSANDIEKVEIDNRKYKENIIITPVKGDNDLKWNIEGQQLSDVNQQQVGNVIMFARQMVAYYQFDKADNDLSQYGLGEPTSVVTVTYGNGKVNVIAVGDKYGASEGTYILLNDDDKVYVVSDYVRNYFNYRYSDMLSLPNLANTSAGCQSLYLFNGLEVVTHLAYIPGEFSGTEEWYVLSPTVSQTSSDAVDTLFQNISNLSLSTFVELECEDNTKYGLDKPRFELQSYNASGELLNQLVVGNLVDGTDDTYYCQLIDDDNKDIRTSAVYTIKADQLSLVNVDASAVANVYLASINVYWLRSGKFTVNGKDYTLKIDRKLKYDDDGNVIVQDGIEQSDNTYYINDVLVDDMQFKTFFSKILFLKIEGIVPAETKKGDKLFGYSFETVVPVTDATTGKSYTVDKTYTGEYYQISDTYCVYKNNESENAVFTSRCRSVESVIEAFELMLQGAL